MHESAMSRRAGQQGAGGLALKACENWSCLGESIVCSLALYGAGISVAWPVQRPHCTCSRVNFRLQHRKNTTSWLIITKYSRDGLVLRTAICCVACAWIRTVPAGVSIINIVLHGESNTSQGHADSFLHCVASPFDSFVTTPARHHPE